MVPLYECAVLGFFSAVQDRSYAILGSVSSYLPAESGCNRSGVGVAEGGGGLFVIVVPVAGRVSAGTPGRLSAGVPVAAGVWSRVGVAEGNKDATSVSRKPTSSGIAVGSTVGGRNNSLKSPLQKSHAMPRSETTPTAIGMRRARSNAGRGGIPDKVLPRLYPHSLIHRPSRSVCQG